MSARRAGAAWIVGLALAACSASQDASKGSWTGTVDTLASGQVVVHNTEQPLWPAGAEWRVEEDLRIGGIDGDGPEVFGGVASFAVDRAGRIWVGDGLSQDVRVFDASGTYVRSIGRRGSGPGEFTQIVKVDLGPDGRIWVMDPQNNRLTVFDTAGVPVEEHAALGGFVLFPWPGGFDRSGSYYAPVPQRVGGELRVGVVRYDASVTPVDTLIMPVDRTARDGWEIRRGEGFVRAGIPYQGGMATRLSPRGGTLALLTGAYRIFELDPDGDTLRTITKDFTPLPVTAADRERARDDLSWFIDQGGTIDLTQLPDEKAAAEQLFADDEGNLWVALTRATSDELPAYDVFDPFGRFLGTVSIPFRLRPDPMPIVRDGALYGVAYDELDVPYIVRARLLKP